MKLNSVYITSYTKVKQIEYITNVCFTMFFVFVIIHVYQVFIKSIKENKFSMKKYCKK